MISLVGNEIKKIFKNKIYLFLSLAVIVLPLVFSLYGTLQVEVLTDQGKIISGVEAMKEKIRINQSLAGKITPEWLQKQKDLYQKLFPEFLISCLDDQKMQEVYGPNWKENHALLQGIMDQNNDYEVFYSEHSVSTESTVKNSMTLQYLEDAIEYGEFIIDQKWEDFSKEQDQELGYGEDGKLAVIEGNPTEQTKREDELMKESFRKKEHFYYGETFIIKSMMTCLKNSGVVLGFLMIILFSSMFNKENKDETIALLKTTKNGKRKLFFAKLIATVLLATLIPLLLFGFIFIVHVLLFGMPDFQAPYQLFTNHLLNRMNAWTMGEQLCHVLGLLIVGSITLSLTSLIFSSLIKSNYRSLIISFLFFVIPLALISSKVGTFSIKGLFPLEYMNFSDYLLIETSSIGKYTFYEVFLIYKTILIPILLLPIIYLVENRKEVNNI